MKIIPVVPVTRHRFYIVHSGIYGVAIRLVSIGAQAFIMSVLSGNSLRGFTVGFRGHACHTEKIFCERGCVSEVEHCSNVLYATMDIVKQ